MMIKHPAQCPLVIAPLRAITCFPTTQKMAGGVLGVPNSHV